ALRGHLVALVEQRGQKRRAPRRGRRRAIRRQRQRAAGLRRQRRAGRRARRGRSFRLARERLLDPLGHLAVGAVHPVAQRDLRQRRAHLAGGGKAVRRVLGQAAQDQVVERGRHVGVAARGRRRLHVLDPLDGLEVVLGREQRVRAQELVRDDRRREQVTSPVEP